MSKKQIMQMLEKMPDNSTDYDILREIQEAILIEKDLEASRKDLANGNVHDHESVFEKYKKWLTEE